MNPACGAMETKRITILYNVPLPRELTDLAIQSPDKVKEIFSSHPGLDLSESSVIEDLHDMVCALGACGYEARAVNLNDDFHFLIEELTRRRPDAVFNLCESMNAISKHEAYVAGIY